MAIFVMLIIIVLNIALLIVVMRLGTQGEHHSELSADQSTAVLALHDKLGLPRPEPKGVAVVKEHAEDVVNTLDPDENVIPTQADETKDEAEHEDAVAKLVDGDDSGDVSEQLSISKEEAQEELEDIAEAITDDDADSDDD